MVTLNIPLTIDDETVALVFDRTTGEVYDECGNYDTAENYVLYESEHYYVLAVKPIRWYDDEIRLTTAEFQRALDHVATASTSTHPPSH